MRLYVTLFLPLFGNFFLFFQKNFNKKPFSHKKLSKNALFALFGVSVMIRPQMDLIARLSRA